MRHIERMIKEPQLCINLKIENERKPELVINTV